jgi:hypothetical protein
MSKNSKLKKRPNKGRNPLKIPVKNLTRGWPVERRGHKKADPSKPVKVEYAGKNYPSITAAAKDNKRSRTYVQRVAPRR